MAHSIELLFDDDTDAALRQVWNALTAAGVPSQVRVQSATNRPHVTVAVAARIDAAVDDELAALAASLPLVCTLGAPLVFGRPPELGATARRGPFTLAHLVVPSPELLELHTRVHRICVPHMPSGPLRHSTPGHWTPHATLGRRISAEQLGLAFASVPEVTTELHGSFTALRRWDGDDHVEHLLIS
ncbi:2'-5' RNA ligase family protein [Mycolicibacterium mengxianglii]|uniref:2'-5' RNA ligase family protein n=1 Tax=Mycolicibacterium mengxianglii TaxID=2736649 RepID=UPI0018EF0E5F|nr:2'-5' RNA ligase family protein [Mycolicibacterium mengxianglii]